MTRGTVHHLVTLTGEPLSTEELFEAARRWHEAHDQRDPEIAAITSVLCDENRHSQCAGYAGRHGHRECACACHGWNR